MSLATLDSPGCRVPRLAWASETPGNTQLVRLWHRRKCMFLNAAISRIWHQAGLAYAKRPARRGSTPPSPDVCVRKRDCPPFIPCAGQACRASILALPDSLITPPSGSSPQPTNTRNLITAKRLAAFRPICRHRSAACCQRSFSERRKPPTLMQRSAVPNAPLES